MRWKGVRYAVLVLPLVVQTACTELSRVMGSSWHEKCGWRAEEYFQDPKVIALCKAIEANDLKEIDRLVAGGADVNAKGDGNMTPLLWAYPDNKLERFTRLLEHGADPNIVIESDFNSRDGMSPGDSVTHMACKTAFSGYFEAVFENGGDPNFVSHAIISNRTPLFTLIKGRAENKLAKVQSLIAKGADLDHVDGTGVTPTMAAVGRAQYEIGLTLLKAGANPKIHKPDSNWKLIHLVIGEHRRRNALWTPQQKADYEKLAKWLEDHGESIEAARADIKRWTSWSATTGEFRRKMDAEVAECKAREAREKAVTDGNLKNDE